MIPITPSSIAHATTCRHPTAAKPSVANSLSPPCFDFAGVCPIEDKLELQLALGSRTNAPFLHVAQSYPGHFAASPAYGVTFAALPQINQRGK
jgi:hypothetical protein